MLPPKSNSIQFGLAMTQTALTGSCLLKLVHALALSKTGQLKPSSNQYLPRRVVYTNLGELWAWGTDDSVALIHLDLVPILMIELWIQVLC